MRRLATAAVIALACGSIWVAVAIANGGSSIASAPDMPIGQQVASGYTHPQYGEFWRVNLSAGDELVIDYGVPAGSGSLDLYVYSPGVTDYTLSDAEPAVSDETGSNYKHEFDWVTPSAGRWTLYFHNCCRSTVSYEFTTYVRHFTSTKLSVPRVVAAKHTLKIKGSTAGVTGGRVAITVTTKKWKKSAVVKIATNGTFSWKVKVAKRGTYRVKATYYGDNGHRSSSKAVNVRVV